MVVWLVAFTMEPEAMNLAVLHDNKGSRRKSQNVSWARALEISVVTFAMPQIHDICECGLLLRELFLSSWSLGRELSFNPWSLTNNASDQFLHPISRR